MKSMYVATLMAVAVFSLARADNPPAANASTPTTAAATTATAGGTAATPAAPPAHAKAVRPWRMVTRDGQIQYCREEPIPNSRIMGQHCVNEAAYIKEQADAELVRQNLMKGANGCQPACGH